MDRCLFTYTISLSLSLYIYIHTQLYTRVVIPRGAAASSVVAGTEEATVQFCRAVFLLEPAWLWHDWYCPLTDTYVVSTRGKVSFALRGAGRPSEPHSQVLQREGC